MAEAIVVNLFGGPGAGKSTIAAYVFAELKFMGIDVELVTEYAKDKVWEESIKILENQIYIFGKQHHRLYRVVDKVSVVIMDSPILLSNIYGQDCTHFFKDLVDVTFDNFNNMNYILKRTKHYREEGRMQTLEESKEIDLSIKKILSIRDRTYKEVESTKIGGDSIVKDVVDDMFKNNAFI